MPADAPGSSPSLSPSPVPGASPIARAPFNGPGFAFAYPPGWRPVSGITFGGQYKFTDGTSGFFGLSHVFSVSQAAVGDSIKVSRGQGTTEAVVSGVTLDELAASVERAVQVSPSNRVAIEIGGEPGVRYSTPQASIVGPLASIAIAIHDGRAFVFTENLVLDGPASGEFGTFLACMSFD